MKKLLQYVCFTLAVIFCTAGIASAKTSYSPVYDFEHAKAISLNTENKINLEIGKKTYYKFTLTQKTKIKFVASYIHGYTHIIDANKNVLVNKDDKEEKKDSKGIWHQNKVIELDAGTYYLEYASTSGWSEYNITYSILDFSKPDVPTIKKVNKKTGVIKGVTCTKGTVYIKIGKKIYKKKADGSGKFSVKTKKLKKKTKYSVYVVSQTGVKSDTKKLKVK